MAKIALVYVPGVWEISMPPIGIGYLYAYLKKHGIHAQLFDLNIEFLTGPMEEKYTQPLTQALEAIRSEGFYQPAGLEEYNFYMNQNIDYLKQMFTGLNSPTLGVNPIRDFYRNQGQVLADYDIVGLSVIFKEQIPSAQVLARLIKQYKPSVKLLVGGTSASLKDFAGTADQVILGDGEEQLLYYIQEYENQQQHKTGQTGSGTNSGKDTMVQYCESLEDLPPPDYAPLFEKYRYAAPHKVVPLAITRGCYWGKCQFCSYGWVEPGGKSTARYRKPTVGKIISQIRYLARENQTKYFYFTVDTADPVLLQQLAGELIEKAIKIYWRTEIRAESAFLEPGVLEKLYSAGCRLVSFGLESIVQRVLDEMKKGLSVNNNTRLVQQLYDAGIGINTDFFIGYPSETPEEAAQTQRFIIRNNPKLLSHSAGGVFHPFARSPVVKANKVKYLPGKNEWTKEGMSFKQQERQQQIANANMIFNPGIVRFPFRNDAVYYFLYCTHYPVKQIAEKLRTKVTFLKIYRQCRETFKLTMACLKDTVPGFSFEALSDSCCSRILKLRRYLQNDKKLNRIEMLDMHHEVVKEIIQAFCLTEDEKTFLFEVARVDYYMLLSCLSEGDLPSVSSPPGERMSDFTTNIDRDNYLRPDPGKPVYTRCHDIDVEKLPVSPPFEESPWKKTYTLYDINGIHIYNGEAPHELPALLLEKIMQNENRQPVPLRDIIDREFNSYDLTSVSEALRWLLDEGILVREATVRKDEGSDMMSADTPNNGIMDVLNQLEAGTISLEKASEFIDNKE